MTLLSVVTIVTKNFFNQQTFFLLKNFFVPPKTFVTKKNCEKQKKTQNVTKLKYDY